MRAAAGRRGRHWRFFHALMGSLNFASPHPPFPLISLIQQNGMQRSRSDWHFKWKWGNDEKCSKWKFNRPWNFNSTKQSNLKPIWLTKKIYLFGCWVRAPMWKSEVNLLEWFSSQQSVTLQSAQEVQWSDILLLFTFLFLRRSVRFGSKSPRSSPKVEAADQSLTQPLTIASNKSKTNKNKKKKTFGCRHSGITSLCLTIHTRLRKNYKIPNGS